MPNWSGSILTKKGLQLHAKAEAGATLNLTKIKLGSGLLATGQDVQDLTDLIQPEQEIGIAEKTVGEDGTCTIRGIITNQNVTKGYLIRECGIFADDPDEGEILYAIATDPNPDYLPPQGGATALSQEFAIPIIASNVANITAKIDLNSLATIAYVLNILKSIFGISEDITATTIKNKIVSYTNEVVTNLFGIATATTDSIKTKIKEWAMEKIEEWLETLEIRYNIAQNGYICLGKLFGYATIQWGLAGLWDEVENSVKMGTIQYPIAFKKFAIPLAVLTGIKYSDFAMINIKIPISLNDFIATTNKSTGSTIAWLSIGI